MFILNPGHWLGLLGGGQLGRMFCYAAHSLGYKVMVLDPDADSPAGAVADRHLQNEYDDASALKELAMHCRAVTTEFENVPAPTLSWLAQHTVVAPNAHAVSVAQDRIAEKRFMQSCGLAVAPYAVIQQLQDFETLPEALFPGILKAARLGYDGKGQVSVVHRAQAQAAWQALGQKPCVLEKKLALQYEISVVCARGYDGLCTTFPVAENVHRDGILARSTVPAVQPSLALQRRAEQAAQRIAEALQYVGVLCVEFFVVSHDELLVNEMAPRPHNSGHYSIDACITSQFEQQVRALAGLPLGSPVLHSPAIMLNLLGDVWFDAAGQPRDPDWSSILHLPGVKLHLYGKSEARLGRKMGHITCVGTTADDVRAQAQQVCQRLGLPQ